jgi:hypothetical protein
VSTAVAQGEPVRLRRGLAVREIPGDSGEVYFARAPTERVVAAYARMVRPLSWDRDVYGQKRSGPGEIFYQFKEHAWTGATTLGEPGTFSKQLGDRVFVYGQQDTAGVTYYRIYDSGALVEAYQFCPDARPRWSFTSQLREVGRAKARYTYDFIDATCRWLDLYVEWPPFHYCYEEGLVGRPDLVLSDSRYPREDFERVDWVVGDPRPWPRRRRDW